MINLEAEWLIGIIVRRIIAVLFLFSLLGQIEAFPSGIDSRADNGCLCHGGSDDSTEVTLTGLPDQYNSSQEYNVTLTIVSPVEANSIQGGFRIILSHGELVGEGWQFLDGGYSHTSEITDRRVWDAVWIAPEESDKLATFVIHGNAVNGDQTQNNDEWNSQSLAVPGPEYTGDTSAPDLSNSLTNSEIAIGGIAVLLITALAIMAVRD